LAAGLPRLQVVVMHMSKNTVLLLVGGASLVTACLCAAPARAQGRAEAAPTAGCVSGPIVYDDDAFVGPGPYPYSAAYPDGACLTGKVRVVATPKRADVYVDGFFAGFVEDFDGALQGLPATPGEHAVTLYLEGYRTITRHIVVPSHATVKLRLQMDRLSPDQTSAPPPAALIRNDPSRDE
jgi:hypothetical protein